MPHATSLRFPPNGKFEIEGLVTPGVWVDVTADVDPSSSITMNFGRASEFAQPQQAQFTVTLTNDGSKQWKSGAAAGAYTPQNAGSPYYPNIQPRKRIRYSYNSGSQRFRFTGYVKQWQPTMVEGWRPMMQITAADRLDQLSRVSMLSPIRQEITADTPTYWWPLTDAAGSTSAIEQSGNSGPALAVAGTQAAPLVFGDLGPGFGDGSGVRFPASSSQNLTTKSITGAPNLGTLEVWANTGSATDQAVISLAATGLSSTLDLIVKGATNSGKPALTSSLFTTINGPASVADGGWHHFCITFLGPNTWTLYVDGASVGTSTGAGFATIAGLQLRVGLQDASLSSQPFAGNIGQVAWYTGVLTTTRITAHAAAGKGYYGDTTNVRIQRWLGYAGLTSSDWNLDTGQATVNTYPQDGKDVLSACQDMVTSEGGGSVFYVTPDGKARFVNRRYRDNRTPALTINAVDDLDSSVYSPSFDDLNIVDQITVDRSAEPGTLTSQTYTNTAAVTAFGLFGSQITTYTTTDQDALNLAQYDVNSQSTPALRFPQIGVDLATAGHDLYDKVGQLQVGDRIRLQNIPAAAYPTPSIDFYLEGWTETPGVDSYKVVFDVTPADTPARALWDVSTWDGGDTWTP